MRHVIVFRFFEGVTMARNLIASNGNVYRYYLVGERKVFSSVNELNLPERVLAFLETAKDINFSSRPAKFHHVSLFWWCLHCLRRRHIIEHAKVDDGYVHLITKICPSCGDAPVKQIYCGP
ncbi:MAG: hypothetical protein UW14_C0005G0013 [Candidatus Yanofskybacteria bacterium GW2011_GWA2_44_10]|nr:MAG: hypothetical protein UW14_C0005G0013 [Candidatus Yanofskybacteria bacterium GW2011_GWA2_44_10]